MSVGMHERLESTMPGIPGCLHRGLTWVWFVCFFLLFCFSLFFRTNRVWFICLFVLFVLFLFWFVRLLWRLAMTYFVFEMFVWLFVYSFEWLATTMQGMSDCQGVCTEDWQGSGLFGNYRHTTEPSSLFWWRHACPPSTFVNVHCLTLTGAANVQSRLSSR